MFSIVEYILVPYRFKRVYNGLSTVRAKQSSLCFICSLGTSKICLDKYIRRLGKYQFLLFPKYATCAYFQASFVAGFHFYENGL